MARLLVRCLFLVAFLSGPVAADTVALRNGHPDRHVVVKGDTLWGIAAKFLEDPWRWPQVWDVNPQLANPHLIYPGDVIYLTLVDGEPRLAVEPGRDRPAAVESGAVAEPATVKAVPGDRLEPRIRESAVDQAIAAIPLDAIRQFLSDSQVVLTEEELNAAPYVFEGEEGRLMSAAGNRVYVRSIPVADATRYGIYRIGDPYRRPGTREVLGVQATFVATARLEVTGDPATMLITRSVRETLRGDRVLPASDVDRAPRFLPRPVDADMEAQIIAVLDGVERVGQFQVVVIDRGGQDGLADGHVFGVFDQGGQVRDTLHKDPEARVRLPDLKGGVVMVFRTFDRVSYGLVMSATRALRVGNKLRRP